MSDPTKSATHNTDSQKRSWLWIGLFGVVIVAAVLAGTTFLQPNSTPTASAANMSLNSAEVVIADLTQEETYHGKLESIKGTGTLIPAAQIELAFTTSGIVADLPVQVGQTVQAGDLLAQIDVGTLAAQDEVSVAQAQINLDVAQQALDDLLNWEQDADGIAQM